MVVVPHMRPLHHHLAEHLDRLGLNRCAEAVEGETLAPGRIHLAPGDRHLLIDAAAPGFRARLTTDPPVNFCRPAVDPMLRSAAKASGGRLLAAILTGMGHDGLEGCREVAAAGGTVLAQDEAIPCGGLPGAVRGPARQLLGPPRRSPNHCRITAERVTDDARELHLPSRPGEARSGIVLTSDKAS